MTSTPVLQVFLDAAGWTALEEPISSSDELITVEKLERFPSNVEKVRVGGKVHKLPVFRVSADQGYVRWSDVDS